MSLTVRLIAAGVALLLAVAGIAALNWRPGVPRPIELSLVTIMAPFPSSIPARDSATQLEERSPFAQDRAPFRRTPAVPLQPVPDLRLVAIARDAAGSRATLTIGAEQFAVPEGGDSPAGRIARIEDSAIVFDDGIRLELFGHAAPNLPAPSALPPLSPQMAPPFRSGAPSDTPAAIPAAPRGPPLPQ